MIDENDIKKIKEVIREFLQKITITDFTIELKSSSVGEKNEESKEGVLLQDIVDVDIELKEPQILIGSNGQTLFELQRILRIILHKKLGKIFYVKLDINNYQEKKSEYLRNLARDIADEVSLTKKKNMLPPMPAYQRKIIHMELAKRLDVIVESEGVGENRYIAISSN